MPAAILNRAPQRRKAMGALQFDGRNQSAARMESFIPSGHSCRRRDTWWRMFELRPFQAPDLDALYAISLMTGHAGGDASHLYRDGRLIGHIYSAPYACLGADLVRVAADRDGVVGFVAGALDTLAWEATLERSWWPPLRAAYADPDPARSPAWNPDERRAAMIHAPERTPPAIAAACPAHVHLNLAPRAQGQGLGTRLLAAWLELAAARGAHAVHAGVNRANLRAIGFWRRHGFRDLATAGAATSRTVWMGRT
jgi:ribosomal protein S18 acetylase RimI-like enzyme